MIVRYGTREDVPQFVEAGRTVHQTTHLRAHPYNAVRVANTLTCIVANPQGSHCFIVAVDADQAPVGWIIGCIERHFFSDQPVASVVNYGVLPERRAGGAGLRLLTAFRKWAVNRGAVELAAGINSGVAIERMDRFLKRLGFRLMGGNYSLTLSKSRLRISAP